MNWKHKIIRYLPLGLKQSETSHGSTNFHFAESGKELQSTFLSPTQRLLQWVGTWIPDLKLQLPMRKLKLILHSNQLEGLLTWRHATWFRHIFFCKNIVFNISYWSDGKCQEKLKTMLKQNLEPITIQAEKVNRKRKIKKWKPAVEVQWTSLSLRHMDASYVLGIQLLQERLLEKMCPRQPRRLVWVMINTLFLTL